MIGIIPKGQSLSNDQEFILTCYCRLGYSVDLSADSGINVVHSGNLFLFQIAYLNLVIFDLRSPIFDATF